MPIKNRISEFQKDMQTWRHHFHEFPELAYKEIKTSNKVVELLRSFKVDKIETGNANVNIFFKLNNKLVRMILNENIKINDNFMNNISRMPFLEKIILK